MCEHVTPSKGAEKLGEHYKVVIIITELWWYDDHERGLAQNAVLDRLSFKLRRTPGSQLCENLGVRESWPEINWKKVQGNDEKLPIVDTYMLLLSFWDYSFFDGGKSMDT